MWQSEVSIDVNAPAADVYAYLADFQRHREWSTARMVELRELTPGAIRVGSEFEASETAPARIVTRSRITALEPDRRIAWHSWFGQLMAADWEFVLSKRLGVTNVVQRSSGQPGNPGMELFHRVIRRRRIPIENRHSLDRFKAVVERRALAS